MKKWHYKLMTRGKRNKISVMGKIYDVDYNVPFLSPVKYVFAPDEDTARYMIHETLTDFKWTSFVLMVEMNKEN